MYRIYDRPEAIRRVQQYLAVAGNPDIFVAPTGIFDDNTRLSVIDFQSGKSIEPSGIVDRNTFDALFAEYVIITERENIRRRHDSFIIFPILPNSMSDAMMHINRTLARLLTHYGQPHSLRNSNFYSKSTSEAVDILRGIYNLEKKDLIDEDFYSRMIRDHDSIGDRRRIF